MATRHSTRGGLSLMSETEFSQSPEGHPPEQPGGSGTSPPDGPRAAPRPKPKIGHTRPAPAVAAPPPAKAAAQVVPLKRPEAAAPKENRSDLGEPELPLADADGEADGRRNRSRRRSSGRDRKSKQVGRYLVCVHVQPDMTQIAMLEGRSLVEHYVSRSADDTNQIDGNVYRGRVQNVLPGMEAAFIDIGIPKNAVLYRGDVHYDAEDVGGGGAAAQPRIEDVLKAGQTILCQVTKNRIGAKGARLTQEVSLPGRFAVLVPNSSAFGISKRLGDNERRRLRR